MDLKDKIFIVTGATSGIGRAAANLFAPQGARLILSGRDVNKGKSLLEELKPIDSAVYFLPGDVRGNAFLVVRYCPYRTTTI